MRLPHPFDSAQGRLFAIFEGWVSSEWDVNMTKHLRDLFDAAKKFVLTPEEKEQQPIRLLPFGQSLRAGSDPASLTATWQSKIRSSRATRHPITPKPGVLGNPEYRA